ncbi:MAG TPA: HdeD family acid-resistance protein [Longimicrobiales bacterium]
MAHPLVRNWGTLVLEGLVAILFGIIFLAVPFASLLALTYVFGAFAIVDGVLALVSMFSPERSGSRWALAIYGIAGIIIGILAFVVPRITIMAFVYLLAAWAFIIGILRIISAIALRREIRGEWVQILAGIVAVAFGLYLLFAPSRLIALVLAIGVYAIIKGVLLVISGIQLRHHVEEMRRRAGPGPTLQGRAAA